MLTACRGRINHRADKPAGSGRGSPRFPRCAPDLGCERSSNAEPDNPAIRHEALLLAHVDLSSAKHGKQAGGRCILVVQTPRSPASAEGRQSCHRSRLSVRIRAREGQPRPNAAGHAVVEACTDSSWARVRGGRDERGNNRLQQADTGIGWTPRQPRPPRTTARVRAAPPRSGAAHRRWRQLPARRSRSFLELVAPTATRARHSPHAAGDCGARAFSSARDACVWANSLAIASSPSRSPSAPSPSRTRYGRWTPAGWRLPCAHSAIVLTDELVTTNDEAFL